MGCVAGGHLCDSAHNATGPADIKFSTTSTRLISSNPSRCLGSCALLAGESVPHEFLPGREWDKKAQVNGGRRR